MCDCCKAASEADSIDKTLVKTYSDEIIDLFRTDVSIGLFDNAGDLLYSYSSDPETAKGYRAQAANVIKCISNCENAINQLNTAWRENDLHSFRLLCHSSSIYVWLLGEAKHRLVIISKQQGPEPDDQRLKSICMKFESAIRSFST